MTKERYESFYGLHDERELILLSHAKIGIFGAGAGSPLTQHLAREGVATAPEGLIILADPGKVSERNLGRQFYFEKDLNKSKVLALNNNIKAINNDVNVKVIPEGVTSLNIRSLTKEVDVIVEMVDISHPDVTLLIHDEAARQKKPVVTGLDLSDDCLAYFFDYRERKPYGFRDLLALPNTVQAENFKEYDPLAIVSQMIIGENMQKLSTNEDARNYYGETFFNDNNLRLLMTKLSPEMQRVAKIILSGNLSFLPQTDIGGTLLGALHAKMIKGIIINQPVRKAPEAIRINLSDEII